MKDKAGLLGSGEDPSKAWGIKGAVLIGLLVQNASHALLTRYSQGILKETYSSTSILICAEIIKTVFSAYLSVNDKAETDAVGQGMSKLIWLASHGSKMITLVILYGSANILAYFALARVDGHNCGGCCNGGWIPASCAKDTGRRVSVNLSQLGAVGIFPHFPRV